MKSPPPLSDAFNDMVGKPLNEAAFRNQTQQEGYESRIIRPGDSVSKDARLNRVNARVGEDKKIESIYFG